MRVSLIALQHDVFILKGEQICAGLQEEARERIWRAGELQLRLIEVVQIEVRVAKGMNEIAGLKP
jgi:hypothetical protein